MAQYNIPTTRPGGFFETTRNGSHIEIELCTDGTGWKFTIDGTPSARTFRTKVGALASAIQITG